MKNTFTQEELDAFYALQNKFDEAIYEAADEYCLLTGDSRYGAFGITDYGTDDGTIIIEGDDWNYGECQHHSFLMPVKFVVSEEYRAELRVTMARKKQEKEAEEARKAEEKAAADKEKRRQEFERLQKEFAK